MKKLSLTLLITCFLALGTIPLFSQEELPITRPALKGGITSSNYLPPDLYGSWSVTAYLQSTSAPDFFTYKTSEIWELKQVGEKIILSNRLTGASASVTVNEVKNNTASFTRVSEISGRLLYENPIITVNQDKFEGVTKVKIKQDVAGKSILLAEAVYTIEGSKLAGPTLKIFDVVPSQ